MNENWRVLAIGWECNTMTLSPNGVTSTKWQHFYPGYYFLILYNMKTWQRTFQSSLCLCPAWSKCTKACASLNVAKSIISIREFAKASCWKNNKAAISQGSSEQLLWWNIIFRTSGKTMTTHSAQLQAITIMLNSMSFCPACWDFTAWQISPN